MSQQNSSEGDPQTPSSEQKKTEARKAARDSVLQDLAHSIDRLSRQSESLNETLDNAVQREELKNVIEMQWKRRWRTALFLFFLIVGITQVQDMHVEDCVVDNYVHREIDTVVVCDLLFPTHSHGYIESGEPTIVEPQWPTPANQAGIALYTIIVLGLIFYPALSARRRASNIVKKELNNGNGKPAGSDERSS